MLVQWYRSGTYYTCRREITCIDSALCHASSTKALLVWMNSKLRAVSRFSFESRRSRTRDLRPWQRGIDYEYCPPFQSSRIVERAKRKRVSPFLAWGDFHAHSRFARSTIPEEKWGTTRSLNEERIACVAWRFWFCAQSKKGGRGQRNRELSTAPDKTAMPLACENIRFFTLFAAGDVSSPRNVPSAEELNGCFRRLPCYAG